MKGKLHHAISSSDEEQQKPEGVQPDVAVLRTLKALDSILSSDEVVKYDINVLKTSDTLFEEDITKDDEIWFVQSPNKEIDLNLMRNIALDFDSPESHLRCKVKKKKKRYNVYAIPSTSNIDFTLPSRRTKTFNIKSFPLAGKLVLQENVRIKRDTDKCESTQCESVTNNSAVADYEEADTTFDLNEISEIRPIEYEESFRNKKKKKRSSIFNSANKM